MNYQCPNQKTISRCPLYHFSDAGENECSPCPAGFNCSYPDVAAAECDPGFYAEVLDAVCQPCPIGHECPGGTVVPTLCLAGTYASKMA